MEIRGEENDLVLYQYLWLFFEFFKFGIFALL